MVAIGGAYVHEMTEAKALELVQDEVSSQQGRSIDEGQELVFASASSILRSFSKGFSAKKHRAHTVDLSVSDRSVMSVRAILAASHRCIHPGDLRAPVRSAVQRYSQVSEGLLPPTD